MAIQKHNTYYDTTKPNSGIYCYDENGNHKEVLTKNDLNAISSISSINDKVTALSSKTVSEIKSTDTVTATPHTAPDGTIYYELEAAPEVSDTEIYGENGISSTNQGTKWTIGLSADYLSANALDNLSGNWQNTYNTVKSNSSVWDTVKDRVYSADFIPVKDDVDVLKTNSAHYPVESTNGFITVGSANHKFTLTFNSGDLVTSGWVEERLKDFGGFTTANPGPSGEPAVDEPSTKLIYLVPDDTVTGNDKYSEWIYGTNSAWICIGETSVDLEPLYELSGKFIYHSVNKDLHIQEGERTKWNEVSAKLNKDDFNSWSAKTVSWDISSYSGGFGIDVTDHMISLTENYLSANALDNLSGKWEKASDTLIASSGKWNDTYETVSANSARWDKVDEKLDTSVFESYTATADDIPYSGKNGIAIENHEVWISADYLSANALKDLSGKWENASDVVIADSAKWNSAYSAIASANLWNGTYERVQASADEWDKVVNKLDKSESAKYMMVDKIDKTTDDKISGYDGTELYYPPVKEYSGKDGIKVEDYFIGIDSGWLDERYQEKGDYYSASNPSGFINSAQAEAQIIAKKYITSSVSELDNFYSKSQTSGANEIANAIKDFVTEDLLVATSGELKTWVSTNYYDKTETSSKEALETAFGSKQDNLTQEQLLAISNVSSKLNTTAFSTVSGTFALKSEIPTVPTKVSDLTDSANYYKTTETSSKDELSTEFAKYVTTALLDTVSSTLGDDIEYVSGQVDNKVNKPTTLQTGKLVYDGDTSAWSDIGLDDYVPYSAINLAIGSEVDASAYSFAQGWDNSANWNSVTFGTHSTAYSRSLAVGENAVAYSHSISIGGGANSHCNSADGQSIAVGNGVSARYSSIAVGSHSTVADTNALSIGGYCVASGTGSVAIGFRNSAYNVFDVGGGQAFGRSLEISGGLAIGYYNATKDAAFVIGNGTGNDDDTVVNRSDSFVIYRNGSVSAKGDISANGVKLGPGGGTSFTGVTTAGSISGDGLTNPLGLKTSAENALTSVSSKVDIPDTTQTVLNNNYLIYSTLTGAGTTTGWMPLSANYYSKSEANGTFVATAFIDTTTLSGNGKTVSTKLGVNTDVIATKDYVDSSFLPLSGGTESGSVQFSVASGKNILAVASAATLIGASRQTTEHYGVDNTALGTTWVGVGGDGMHQGFIKYTDGGDVGALDSNSTIQLNLKPSTNKFDSIQVQINGGSVGYLIPAVTSTTTAGLTNDGILHIILES